MRAFFWMLTLVPFISHTSVSVAQLPTDNSRVQQIRDADQSDRSTGNLTAWKLVTPRDAARRTEIAEIIKAGGLRTATDYRNAALVYQHGRETNDIRLAFSLATVSVAMEPSDKAASWLTAAAWDRILMQKNVPQWYGTQFKRPNDTGIWEMYKVDETVIADAERISLGVPTLAENRERVRKMNEKK